ncbi:MAG: signal peptidase II [Desulfobaccales bacterium]
MSRRLAISLPILVGGVLLDQITKLLVVRSLPVGGEVPVIRGFFSLVHIYNRGAAFGLFANLSLEFAWLFFIITTALVLAVVAYLLWRLPDHQTLGITGYSLIFTGAVGNLIDRLRLGEVIDFFDFHIGRFHWPAFNVADSLICIGAGFLLWFIFQEEKKSNVSDSL